MKKISTVHSTLFAVFILVVFFVVARQAVQAAYITQASQPSYNLAVGDTSPFTPTPTGIGSTDNAAPSVQITNPLNGSTVKKGSTVQITANATDNVGVASVQFAVNGSTLCTDTVAPYSCSWIPAARGTYQLFAIAADLSGNTAAASVTVTSR